MEKITGEYLNYLLCNTKLQFPDLFEIYDHSLLNEEIYFDVLLNFIDKYKINNTSNLDLNTFLNETHRYNDNNIIIHNMIQVFYALIYSDFDLYYSISKKTFDNLILFLAIYKNNNINLHEFNVNKSFIGIGIDEQNDHSSLFLNLSDVIIKKSVLSFQDHRTIQCVSKIKTKIINCFVEIFFVTRNKSQLYFNNIDFYKTTFILNSKRHKYIFDECKLNSCIFEKQKKDKFIFNDCINLNPKFETIKFK